MTYELEFSANVHHAGENVTVRLGTKWLRRLAVGDQIVLHGDDGTRRPATVRGRIACRVADIPPDLLLVEHDRSCRCPEGLLAELERLYGEANMNSLVTVIVYAVPNAE